MCFPVNFAKFLRASFKNNSLTSMAGNSQLFDQSFHVTKDSSLCIDLILLIFMINASSISTLGVELLLFVKCHHLLACGEISFNIPVPPPYIKKSWVTKIPKYTEFSVLLLQSVTKYLRLTLVFM